MRSQPLRFRKPILFAALAAVVGLVVIAPRETAVVANVERKSVAPRPAAGESLQIPERQGFGRPRGELFGAPPAPPQPVAAREVAPQPVAPPLPYRFVGKVIRGAEEEVLLSKGDLVFPVKVGDTVDGTYKVESIDAERIELVYLPLGTKDRVAVNSLLEPPPAPVVLVPAPPQPMTVAPVAPAAGGGPAQLRWEGPRRVEAGARFSVTLRVTSKEPLRAAPMQLRFEPGVLEPVNVRPGKFFGDANFSYRVNPAGSIFVGASSEPAPPGVDAELVVVTFRSLKRGATAELSMSALSLQGAAGRAIAHEQVGAFRAAIY